MKTKLIIDTSTIISLDKLPPFVSVIPLNLIETYNDEEKSYDDIKQINVYDIKKGLSLNKSYKTSQPNLAYIYDEIEKDYDKYDRIIINPISAGISSTFNTIKGILNEVDRDKKVLLLDSKKCSYIGWVFNQELFKLIEQNKTNDEIIDFINKFNKNSGLFFFLTNIDFLIKGGRVSSFKGFIAKKLEIVIGIFWRDGELKSLTKNKSIEKLFSQSLELELKFKNKKITDIEKINFYYNDEDSSKFENFINEIKQKYNQFKIIRVDYELPSAIYVHTGSGGIYFDIFFKWD